MRASHGDDAVWCLVGNVIQEHKVGESEEVRRGAKHFSPGTKLHCMPPLWGDGFERTAVVGLARGSRRWITVVMPTVLITNWRAKTVYQPAVLRRLREGHEGRSGLWASKRNIEGWVTTLRQREETARGNVTQAP